MDIRKVDLTLTIPVAIYGDSLENCMDAAQRVLQQDDWNEGRYPLFKELFGHALEEMLKNVAFESIKQALEVKYGKGHMTSYDNGQGQYNTAWHEAENWLHDNLKGITVMLDGWRAEVKVNRI